MAINSLMDPVTISPDLAQNFNAGLGTVNNIRASRINALNLDEAEKKQAESEWMKTTAQSLAPKYAKPDGTMDQAGFMGALIGEVNKVNPVKGMELTKQYTDYQKEQQKILREKAKEVQKKYEAPALSMVRLHDDIAAQMGYDPATIGDVEMRQAAEQAISQAMQPEWSKVMAMVNSDPEAKEIGLSASDSYSHQDMMSFIGSDVYGKYTGELASNRRAVQKEVNDERRFKEGEKGKDRRAKIQAGKPTSATKPSETDKEIADFLADYKTKYPSISAADIRAAKPLVGKKKWVRGKGDVVIDMNMALEQVMGQKGSGGKSASLEASFKIARSNKNNAKYSDEQIYAALAKQGIK